MSLQNARFVLQVLSCGDNLLSLQSARLLVKVLRCTATNFCRCNMRVCRALQVLTTLCRCKMRVWCYKSCTATTVCRCKMCVWCARLQSSASLGLWRQPYVAAMCALGTANRSAAMRTQINAFCMLFWVVVFSMFICFFLSLFFCINSFFAAAKL